MGQDILGAVIAVEAEIQEMLASERQSAAEIRSRAAAEAEAAVAAEEKRISDALVLARRDAEAAASAKAAALVQEARERAGRMVSANDDVLRSAIARHLLRILPGKEP